MYRFNHTQIKKILEKTIQKVPKTKTLIWGTGNSLYNINLVLGIVSNLDMIQNVYR